MGWCKKDVTPLLTHWSYIFFALNHRYYLSLWEAGTLAPWQLGCCPIPCHTSRQWCPTMYHTVTTTVYSARVDSPWVHVVYERGEPWWLDCWACWRHPSCMLYGVWCMLHGVCVWKLAQAACSQTHPLCGRHGNRAPPLAHIPLTRTALYDISTTPPLWCPGYPCHVHWAIQMPVYLVCELWPWPVMLISSCILGAATTLLLPQCPQTPAPITLTIQQPLPGCSQCRWLSGRGIQYISRVWWGPGEAMFHGWCVGKVLRLAMASKAWWEGAGCIMHSQQQEEHCQPQAGLASLGCCMRW